MAGGIGAETIATVMRVGAAPVPIPSGPLRTEAVPTIEAVRHAILTTMSAK